METQHRHISSMGTRLDIVFPGMEPDHCDGIITQIESELHRLDLLLSNYRFDSELSHLNSTAYAGTMEISQELYDILSQVKQLSDETGGYFDVTMKPVSDYLISKEGQEQIVDSHTIDIVGMDQLMMEKEGVRFKREGVMLDLGGFGKGYAVKRIIMILQSAGLECALISFGESLIYGLGTHPYGDTWRVSVPGDPLKGPLVFDLKDEALSTSGNSLNNQKKFAYLGHIVNPITLQMTTTDGLVSVKAKDPVKAEVYSTALFSAGPDLSKKILKSVPGVEYRWVGSCSNGTI
jgi:thiamine biosynthesis lipoprotein